MYVSPRNFFLLVNDLHFIFILLIHVKQLFSFIIIIYIIIVIITFILILSAPLVVGGEFSKWIRAAWSAPTHWLLWVSRGVSIDQIFFFNKFFLGDHRWGVDALFHNYHITFNNDAKEARNIGLSFRCHLSNSQIVFSV